MQLAQLQRSVPLQDREARAAQLPASERPRVVRRGRHRSPTRGGRTAAVAPAHDRVEPVPPLVELDQESAPLGAQSFEFAIGGVELVEECVTLRVELDSLPQT